MATLPSSKCVIHGFGCSMTVSVTCTECVNKKIYRTAFESRKQLTRHIFGKDAIINFPSGRFCVCSDKSPSRIRRCEISPGKSCDNNRLCLFDKTLLPYINNISSSQHKCATIKTDFIERVCRRVSSFQYFLLPNQSYIHARKSDVC